MLQQIESALDLNLIIETSSQEIFSTFIFKIEQFAKSNVPGFVDG